MALSPRDGVPADPALALADAAAFNPELQRLLAERDLLMQRMEEIAQRSPGAFAGHDSVRFPVEPLGERRARDARWMQARDESRSDAIQRIIEARRRDAAAELDRWPETRERQRVQAASDAEAVRREAEAQAQALDARIERARRDLLTERWAARPSDPGDDWHTLREQQATEALAKARARSAEAAAREQALERRTARDPARRPDDGSEARKQARAQALDLARRQAMDAAAAEQALDRRLALAREDRLRENRAAHASERAPPWVSPSDHRDSASLPPKPSRPLPLTAAERSLDERIARAREAEPPRPLPLTAAERPPDERTARAREPEPPRPLPRTAAERPPSERVAHVNEAEPPRPLPLTPAERLPGERIWRVREAEPRAVPSPVEAPVRERRASAEPPIRERQAPVEPFLRARQPTPAEPARRNPESFEQRRDRLRAALAEARRREKRAKRIGEAAVRVERAAGAVRKLDSSLDRLGRELREIGADDKILRPVEKAREASAKLSSGAEGVQPAAGIGRGVRRAWDERRDRVGSAARKPGDLGGFRAAAERRLGMAIGSVDDLTALRDKARALWPERKKEREKEKEKQPPPPPKTPAERLQDLDKRREQALERVKARRQGERRDERRRGLSLDRLASTGDRFGNPGG